jgi:ABC-type antimicrobial peptide transport system, ATPase component
LDYAGLMRAVLLTLRRNKLRTVIMEILQKLNERGLTIVLVTHEHDIAQFAKRVLVSRDGKIRKDDLVANRPRAEEVLRTLPTLED